MLHRLIEAKEGRDWKHRDLDRQPWFFVDEDADPDTTSFILSDMHDQAMSARRSTSVCLQDAKNQA